MALLELVTWVIVTSAFLFWVIVLYWIVQWARKSFRNRPYRNEFTRREEVKKSEPNN
jgi:O-antigen/teichoic acid export membrane protein